MEGALTCLEDSMRCTYFSAHGKPVNRCAEKKIVLWTQFFLVDLVHVTLTTTCRAGTGGLETCVEQPAVLVEQVVDTTGAGDCFTAAYAVGVLRGMSAQEAMRFAATAAAVCVQRMGAMTSLPSQEDVEALYI